MKMEGLDQLERRLREMSRKAQAMSGTRNVPFSEMFPPAFMRRRTDFASIEEMIEASGISGAHEIGGDTWNGFVRSRTRFSGWEAMRSEAAMEYTKRGLGL